MNRAEWQKEHGFTDEDFERIDLAKKLFGGKIVLIQSIEEYKRMNADIGKMNKINIDKLWIK